MAQSRNFRVVVLQGVLFSPSQPFFGFSFVDKIIGSFSRTGYEMHLRLQKKLFVLAVFLNLIFAVRFGSNSTGYPLSICLFLKL